MTSHRQPRTGLYCHGGMPLGGGEISMRTGRPQGSWFGLLVEARLAGERETAILNTSLSAFMAEDLASVAVIAKLKELAMPPEEGFRMALSDGRIIVRDPNKDICAVLLKRDNGEIKAAIYITPYTMARKNEKIALTAGLKSGF